MDFDVFLSHSSHDASAARRLRTALDKVGLRTWMAPDDVVGSRPWPEQIADAVAAAKLMVVLVSPAANQSDHVAREVALAVQRRLALLPVRLEDMPTVGSLDYLLQLVQRVDAYPGGMEGHADPIAARALTLVRGGPAPAVVVAQVGPRASRRTVTVLFTDVAGSTEMGEQLDPEALRALMGRYFSAIKQIVERHGGTVEKFIGDAVMAVFGIPVLHEDDALRAVRAAAEVRDMLGGLNEELRGSRGLEIVFRTGVNTGEVVAGDPSVGHTLVTGDTVNTAARLEQAAQSGEILIGRSTQRLVRDAVTVEPVESIEAKGKAAPLVAYRLVSVTPGSEGHARRLDAPLVGREGELRRLQQAYKQAVADRSCQLFTLLGSAGVGKSRLVLEFVTSVADEATVLKGRCLPYGEGITYWPLREIIHQAAGIDERDNGYEARAKLEALLSDERDGKRLAARIASAVGLSTEAAPQEEIFWATRRLFEHLAHGRQLVVLLEDIHWAEPALLDLLEHIADLARDAPLLLLCPARPELLDKRPGWGGGKVNATTVLLEPLASDVSDQLIHALPGGRALPDSLRERILTAAEGNPLYLEEMLGMLIDDGLVVEVDGVWQAEGGLGRVAVPPTVHALLAARLDQLSATERAVAERASVVGRVFEQAAVTELASETLRPEVARGLIALVRKELVRPERSELVAGDAYKFRHLLIRDAAYEALPKAERAELHERFADWLERIAGERVMEYEEVIGYHLEQAHRYRAELGEAGENVERLGERAGGLLARSGQRALGRGDLPAASDLFSRGTRVLPHGRSWAEAATSLAVVEGLLGESKSALPRLDEVIAVARTLDEAGLEWRARVARANVSFFIGEQTDPGAVENAIEVFQRSNDTEGLAAAWLMLAFLAGAAGDPRQAARATKALEFARAAGDKHIEARALLVLAGRLTYGPDPTSQAVMEGERLLAQAGGNLRAMALVRAYLSFVVAMRGDFERAREMADESLLQLEGLGLASDAAWVRGVSAVSIEVLAERYEAAEAALRVSYPLLEGLGKSRVACSIAGSLAELLALQGRDDEAEGYALIASAVEDDFDPRVRGWRARALILVHRGELSEAESLARSAVAVSIETDDINMQGDCFATLASVLLAAGRSGEAKAALTDALSRYEQKGNLVAARRISLALDNLAAHLTRPR